MDKKPIILEFWNNHKILTTNDNIDHYEGYNIYSKWFNKDQFIYSIVSLLLVGFIIVFTK